MQTVKFLTREDVERIVEIAVLKRAEKIAKEIMRELEQRVPDPGPKTLKDEDSVDLLGLSVRSSNVLNNAEIRTIGQLAAKTEAELLKYRNFGRASMIEIETRLAWHGRRLSQYRKTP